MFFSTVLYTPPTNTATHLFDVLDVTATERTRFGIPNPTRRLSAGTATSLLVCICL